MILKKLNKKKVIMLIVSIICVVLIILSAVKIFGWFQDNKQIDDEIQSLDNIKVEEVEDSDKTEKISNNVKKDDLYWKYINTKLINVDFEELKSINKDTVGWIQVSGTNINYPFVQTDNNEYYLNKSFYKKNNNAGWVFLDYRNNIAKLDRNTIIYAHGRVNGTMFGSLKNILTSGWLNDDNNYIVRLSTEAENTLWQVFSVYKIPTTNDYIQVTFKNDKEFLNLAKKLLNRSQHNFKTNIEKNDKILTLSTCYDDNEKVVLHAKLIKRESRY